MQNTVMLQDCSLRFFSKEKQFPEVIEFATLVISSIASKDSLKKIEDP
jgi:hypothetical protein